MQIETPYTARHRAGFAIVLIGLMLMMASASAPSPLYPVLQRDIGFSDPALTGIFAVYTVFLLATLLTAGSCSDHLGRRPVLSVGFAGACAVFAGVRAIHHGRRPADRPRHPRRGLRAAALDAFGDHRGFRAAIAPRQRSHCQFGDPADRAGPRCVGRRIYHERGGNPKTGCVRRPDPALSAALRCHLGPARNLAPA